MSGLARYFRSQGHRVSGYDRSPSPLTAALEAEGMAIVYEDNPDLLPEDIDRVIYTPAIPKDQALWLKVQALGLPLVKRAKVLGEISAVQRGLAVAGTHGKTTTSSLLTHILHTGGLDASAFLGGISQSLGSNFALGTTDLVVLEADEFDRSFLHLHPERAILTSTDADHLDIYGEAEEVRRSYAQFARQVSQKLYLGPGADLPENHGASCQVLRYGIDETGTEGLDLRASRVRVEGGRFYFDLHWPDGRVWADLALSLPGRHNLENALAAAALAGDLGLEEGAVRKALADFKGIQRRFERIAETETQVFIDDYAHHPTELEAAISAAKELYPGRKILGVFQPHLFSRTRDFMPGFARALEGLDELLLLDIYPARELPIAGVDSKALLAQINLQNKELIHKQNLLERLLHSEFGVLLTLGAGDIGLLVPGIAQALFDPAPVKSETND